MAQTQLLRLAHEDAFDAMRQDVAHHVRLARLALGPQCGFKFLIAVEMVLDRPLVAPRDKNQRVDPGRDGFLGRILDQRLVDDRQQLFRHRLGGRQEAGAKTGNGKYSFANGFHIWGSFLNVAWCWKFEVDDFGDFLGIFGRYPE